MWSWMSSAWQSASPPHQSPPPANDDASSPQTQQPRRSQSPRWYETGSTFIIELSLSAHGQFDDGPILYLCTSCVAIADYCLLGRRISTTPGARLSLHLDPGGIDHLEVWLRLRRCGAVRTVPQSWSHEDSCQIALEQHLNESRYLFGWPATESADASNTATQGVWVYHIPRTSTLRRQEATRHGGMEAQLELEWLAECSTMTEYCEKLKAHGAVYYEDVQDSPEAREMGLIDVAGSTLDT